MAREGACERYYIAIDNGAPLRLVVEKDYEVVGDSSPVPPCLSRSLEALAGAATPAEKMAHRWCIETMCPVWNGVHELPNVHTVCTVA
jgi:hypothetical protein